MFIMMNGWESINQHSQTSFGPLVSGMALTLKVMAVSLKMMKSLKNNACSCTAENGRINL